LLKQIADEKQEAERARAEAQRLERQAAAALQATQRERAALERERERLLQQAEAAAEQELADFRRQLAELQLRAGDVNSRRDVQEVQAQSSAVLRQLLERRHKQPRRREAPPADLPLGSWVHIETLGQSGKLLSLDRDHNSAEVQLGSFKVRAKASELSAGHRPAAFDPAETRPRRREQAREERVVTLPAVPLTGTELDLRGKRVADIESELDRFLNDASRAGLPYARIIHGKGTGALRQVVLAQLTGHPLVDFLPPGRERRRRRRGDDRHSVGDTDFLLDDLAHVPGVCRGVMEGLEDVVVMSDTEFVQQVVAQTPCRDRSPLAIGYRLFLRE